MSNIEALTFDAKKDGWDSSRGFTKREVDMPRLDPAVPEDLTSVILKINFGGVCGSDRGIWNRGAFKEMIHSSLEKERKDVRILGHEFFGEIVESGSSVRNLYNLKVGDKVSGDSHVTCGKCYQCRIGEEHVCADDKILGISIDGIFAPYVKIPAKNLWKIDETLVRPEIAAIYDPFGNAVHATTKVPVRGARVGVFGAGPIGLFSVLLLRAFGAAKIYVVDMSKENLAMAKMLGADEVIEVNAVTKKENSWEENREVVDRMFGLTDGVGLDASFEMAGPNSSLMNAIRSTRRGGDVILFGLKDGDFTIPKFSQLITRGITLHSIIGRRIFGTWQIADRVLADHSNGVQDKIWNVILKAGKDTIIPFAEYDSVIFEKKMAEHPKLVIEF